VGSPSRSAHLSWGNGLAGSNPAALTLNQEAKILKISDICLSVTEKIKEEILTCNPCFEVVKIDQQSDEDGSYRIETKMVINGYEYQDTNWLKNDEHISGFVTMATRHYDYIKKLWDEFPEYCKVNEILQSMRNFQVKDIGTITLCRMLKLPNTTECSMGGGDYEVKRTPERANEFLANIDKYTRIFSTAIMDLQDIKQRFMSQAEIKVNL
jgi:hypothetical protein